MVIAIWLILLECTAKNSSKGCILVLGENTVGIGWLFHSSQIKPHLVYHTAVQLISQKLAVLILDNLHCLVSQHPKGTKNNMSDFAYFVHA